MSLKIPNTSEMEKKKMIADVKGREEEEEEEEEKKQECTDSPSLSQGQDGNPS